MGRGLFKWKLSKDAEAHAWGWCSSQRKISPGKMQRLVTLAHLRVLDLLCIGRRGVSGNHRTLQNCCLWFINICDGVTWVQLDFTRQTPSTFYKSFGTFIGAVKPLEQDRNHLRQIGNISAALVKVEERQTQATRGGGGGAPNAKAPNADYGSAFPSGWWKIKDVRVLKVRNSKWRLSLSK